MRFPFLFLITALVLTACAPPPAASPTLTPQPTPTAEPLTPLVLSLSVYIIDDASGAFSSQRTEQEIRDIYQQVNEIWSQANIIIDLQHIERLELPQEVLAAVQQGDFEQFYRALDTGILSVTNSSLLNGFYVNQLFANGVVPANSRVFFVIDTPTVHDERVTAHEIGHILGLHHELQDDSHLMYSGTNGMTLTAEEISTARYVAQGILDHLR